MMLTFVCRRYDMDLRDERELALQRLRILCHSGLFSILDFRSASPAFGLKQYRCIAQRKCSRMHSTKKMLTPLCRHNPLNIFAAHEIAGFCDPSMATKMTVQFNLFGGDAPTAHSSATTHVQLSAFPPSGKEQYQY